MSPTKFVLKCGSIAVLVDLHVLPPGLGGEAHWFTEQHKEEVSEMIRDTVDQRVRHFLETRHHRGHPKPKKALAPVSPICIKGERFRLAAYFMKRHVNLRCVGQRHHGDLRVFPERLVVCASVPEEERGGGQENLTAIEHGGQSKSEYFSGHHETEDPLNSSAITKRNTLQKIAKKALSHPSQQVMRGWDQQGAPPLSAPMETEYRVADEDLVVTLENRREDGGNGDQRPTGAPPSEGASVWAGPRCVGPRQVPGGEPAGPLLAEPGGDGRGRARPQEESKRAKGVCFGQAPASPSEVIAKTHSAESSSHTVQPAPLAFESRPCPGATLGSTLGPTLGSTLGPTPEKALSRQEPGPKPLLPRNGVRASRGGRAGSDADVPSQHGGAEPLASERGVENLPRKSRLKRVKKT